MKTYILASIAQLERAAVNIDPIALRADSICVHGDNAQAVEMARQIRARLQAEGVTLAAFVGQA